MENSPDVSRSLVDAVSEGNVEIARKIINTYGFSYAAEWKGGYALLCIALENNHSEVAELLLASGCTVNYNGNSATTALHYAIRSNNAGIVRTIIDRGGRVNAKNINKETPLHYAVLKRNVEITDLLINRGADVNCHLKTMSFLPRHKNIFSIYYSIGLTALHLAAMFEEINISEKLLNHGARINSRTLNWGYTPLHYASEQGNEQLVKFFLIEGADVNASTYGMSSPLHIATRNGSSTVVNVLLQHGAKVDSCDAHGKTPLFIAVEKRHFSIVEEILKYCPYINNPCYKRLIKIAALGNVRETVNALFKYGFAVNPQDANDCDLFHAAVKNGHLHIIENMLEDRNDAHALCNSIIDDHTWSTPLHTAVQNNQEEVVHLLLKLGADINAENKRSAIPAVLAVRNGFHLNSIMPLLPERGNTMDLLLHIAVKCERIDIVKDVVALGADIKACDQYGNSPLHMTCQSYYKLNALGRKGEIAELLLSEGADVDAINDDEMTPLCSALSNGVVQVVETLLRHNANVNYTMPDGMTPLHIAAKKRGVTAAQMLLNKGANVHATLADGKTTALDIAVRNRRFWVLPVLIHHGANMDVVVEGMPLLHMVTNSRYYKVLVELLELGADVDVRCNAGNTALHIATQGHDEVLVATLLGYGADINSTNAYNHSPVHYAVKVLDMPVSHDIVYMPVYNPITRDIVFDMPVFNAIASHIFLDMSVCNVIKRHIVKMKAANFYVSEENLLLISKFEKTNSFVQNYKREIDLFEQHCKSEIDFMKRHKIRDLKLSYYDFLAKGTGSLVVCMNNEKIVNALNSWEHYCRKFPRYGIMIRNKLKKVSQRKLLLAKDNIIGKFVSDNFHGLPYGCTEKILNYLTNKDLKVLIECYK